MEKKIAELRANIARGDAIRDAGLTPPEDVTRYTDLRYGGDEKANLLDVY